MTVDRRAYNREWARKRREAKLAEQFRTAAMCPRRQGPGACGGRIRTEIGPLGQTVPVCECCERRKRGICRDCNARVYGKVGRATRCERHAQEARLAAVRASEERHRDERLEKSRAYYRDNDEVRRRRNEYKRAWRKANPEKVREQKKRYVERAAANPKSAYNRYHARYRKRHGAHYRELQNTKHAISREGWTPPPCAACGKPTGWTPVPGHQGGRPWSKCMKCIWPCERRDRRRVRREAAKRIAVAPPPKLVRVVRPSTPAVRGPRYERLCITPDCDIVVSHRKKKCRKCREADRAAALSALIPNRGRGRRTDLQERSA